MEPGQDVGVELYEGRYWDAGWCTGVGGSGGVGLLVWMVLTVWLVVELLVVVVVTAMLQGVLVEVDCVEVVFGSSSEGFVVFGALKDFGLLLWSTWRMTLWCWNKGGGRFGMFQSDVGGGKHVSGSRCVTLWNSGSVGIFGFFRFFGFLGVVGEGEGVGVVEVTGGVGLTVGDGGVVSSEDANLNGGRDDCLGGGGARWWVRYKFFRVCGELWKDFPNSLPFFLNFRHNVFLVSLERRSGECG